jgi:ribosomal protein S18 acetylase RimI-like enzyme
VMAHRHEPDRPPAALELAEVDVQRILPAREAAARVEPFGHHLEAVRQIVRLAGVVAESVPTRTFAGFAGGTVAAFCSLHEMAGVGQIEEVTTLSRFRDRGFARALVLHALAASRAAGNDLTIMVADEADWPKDLYRRLGFEPITLRYEFQRAGGRRRAAAPGS